MDTNTQKTLLIVDDDPRIRGLLTESLGALGYSTLQAADGREALDVVRAEELDCVIADIKMPEVDGLTLLNRVKAEKPSLPVVMITGFAYRQHKTQAADAGADGFLMKPFRLAKIEEILARILSRPADGDKQRAIHDVLIVEDDEEFRVLLAEIVEALGYSTEGVGDAEAALKRVATHPPDAIISDYRLPGMTGEDLIVKVKATNPGIPVVLISGYAPSIDGSEFANGAADAFLMKPFRIDRIGDILKSLEDSPASSDKS